MVDLSFTFTTTCWIQRGKNASWHFVSLPQDKSEEIQFFDDNMSSKKRGWGAVKVKAKIGETEWTTSIFPQKSGVYILPIKADVRKAEGVFEGQDVMVELVIDI